MTRFQGGFVAPHLPESHQQNVLIMEVCITAAAKYAAGGYTVFWDGVVGPWFLDQIRQGLRSHGMEPRYVVLRPPREVALNRVRKRDGTTELTGAEEMYDQFAQLGPFESHVLNSDVEQSQLMAACQQAMTDNRYILNS